MLLQVATCWTGAAGMAAGGATVTMTTSGTTATATGAATATGTVRGWLLCCLQHRSSAEMTFPSLYHNGSKMHDVICRSRDLTSDMYIWG